MLVSAVAYMGMVKCTRVVSIFFLFTHECPTEEVSKCAGLDLWHSNNLTRCMCDVHAACKSRATVFKSVGMCIGAIHHFYRCMCDVRYSHYHRAILFESADLLCICLIIRYPIPIS